VCLLRPPAPSFAAGDPLFDDGAADRAEEVSDPFEPLNRFMLRLNEGLDRWVVAPIAHGYALVVPRRARRAVRRVLANLDSPAVFVNDLLQLELVDAGITVTRFAINTSVGLAGVFDVAAVVGIERHDADFGQTLAVWGAPSGPFLIVPVVGPTNVRDASGYVVDMFFRPTTYLFVVAPLVPIVVTSIQEGSIGITAHDAHGEGLAALRASSVDFYAALRSAYGQDRSAQVWRRREQPFLFAQR
jgi:phospholipid-binding lipoprotein MlaA